MVNVKGILEKRIRSHVLHVMETSKALIANQEMSYTSVQTYLDPYIEL